jgi:hypothetical protein
MHFSSPNDDLLLIDSPTFAAANVIDVLDTSYDQEPKIAPYEDYWPNANP